MRRAGVLRAALLGGGAFVPLVLAGLVSGPGPVVAGLPFLAAGVAVVLVARLRGPVERVVHDRRVTPYSALADAARRLRSPSMEEALPGLAGVLADGTGARRASVWLAVGERLVISAAYPDDGVSACAADSVENLAVLLARPGIGHVVPVLDGTELRAVLVIEKPGAPITPADRALMRDVANGAALLLRTVALNAELADRVRRADHLAGELQASRRRLAQAREVERRRLLTELSRATSGRLAALREHVTAARDGLGQPEVPGHLVRARTELDELLDRFRVIARGVYPAVLRSQGPGAALEELIADLRRTVRITGDLDVRVAWEIESGVYQVTAAALELLAQEAGSAEPPVGRPGSLVRGVTTAELDVRVDGPETTEIHVRLTHGGGRVRVLVEDPDPPVTAEQVRTALLDDSERLAALGGDVACPDDEKPGLRLHAWLPDRLDALLESGATLGPGS
ncbi:hypothetical protein [Actinoplanes palleronii]|uniref:Histidine kinase n=1 Tax=Actinoplanes palleronii TaxID=113570 RepID=A0ABQ4BJJ9_9ACTN|nr:hypothetical protein [Actinoplanes palleronii]GIE70852.1 hypothetical protein Apa02nite_069600 [Actinoplanes palleronii]